MPHQCTTCGRTFPDGSKEMLSGCPDCGGNKFQFTPKRPQSSTQREEGRQRTSGQSMTTDDDSTATGDSAIPTDESASSEGSPPGESSSFGAWPDSARRPADRSDASLTESDRVESGTHGRRQESGTDFTGDSTGADTSVSAEEENAAQASARSDVVTRDELPAHTRDGQHEDPLEGTAHEAPPETHEGRVVSEPDEERPSLDELREELNDQFESIKIVRPGQYELNLMELYDREEYIVSLQEDGRYVIDVPDSWRDGDDH